MKVLCVAKLYPAFTVPGFRSPNIGDTRTVAAEEKDDKTGCLMYQLAEFPPVGHHIFIYEACAFAPLNGPDEVELMADSEGFFVPATKIDMEEREKICKALKF